MTSLGGAESSEGRLLYRGAEADIFLGRWSGRAAVYKVRKRLQYRLESLDRTIRRQRTLREAGMIADAKAAGVEAPYLYFLSVPEATLVMEYVAGSRMKDAVSGLRGREAARLFHLLGSAVARLHAAGIMHGDVTTANVIIRHGKLVFIDFGLSIHSTRTEDHAVDLRLIKETITGAHASLAGPGTEALFDGYSEVVGSGVMASVRRQLRGIERRGRYARVE
ncbi:MAG: Kae1-associated kinase Bud32 [Nitrososphaerales archaeon]|nr:Kae1-associated kinase Bud32 [Nitrososphaerales archaeon]